MWAPRWHITGPYAWVPRRHIPGPYAWVPKTSLTFPKSKPVEVQALERAGLCWGAWQAADQGHMVPGPGSNVVGIITKGRG